MTKAKKRLESESHVKALASSALEAYQAHRLAANSATYTAQLSAYRTLYDAYDLQENSDRDSPAKKPAQLRMELNRLLNRIAKEVPLETTPDSDFLYPVYQVEKAQLEPMLHNRRAIQKR